MREIRFRVWDPILAKIIFSYDENDQQGQIHQLEMFFLHCSIKENIFDKELKIMQYAGIKDKNGVEIYEGDIIHSNYSDGKPCRHIIKWSNENAGFFAEHIDGLDEWLKSRGNIDQTWITEFEKEVIGNIYQNLELL